MSKKLIDTIVPNDLLKGKKFYVRKKECNTYVGIKFDKILVYSTFGEEETYYYIHEISAKLADGNVIHCDDVDSCKSFTTMLSNLGYETLYGSGKRVFLYEKVGEEFIETSLLYDYSSNLRSKFDSSEIRMAKPKCWYYYEEHEVKTKLAAVYYDIVSGRMSLYDNTEKRFVTRKECELANPLEIVDFEEEIDHEKEQTLKEIEETERKMAELQTQLVKLRGAL